MHSEKPRLLALGWDTFFEKHFLKESQDTEPARIVEEHRGSYRIRAESGEYSAEVTGRMRHHVDGHRDLPAVGDWIVARFFPPEHKARIQAILPRRTAISRKDAGRKQREQIVAANVDIVFIVSSMDQDLNPRRIERYLAMVWNSGAMPVVLLNKADCCPDIEAAVAEIGSTALGVPVHALSATTGSGIEAAHRYLSPGKTAVFVGSSGVGKSSLINRLLDEDFLPVNSIREKDRRGRHTSTSRQMLFLPGGGIVIDTPGMREIGLWENPDGLARSFTDIAGLARGCRFRNCTHTSEPGCAVLQAVAEGVISPDRLRNHHKLRAELEFQQRKADPLLARETKEKWKNIHKAMKRNRTKWF